MIGEVQPPQRFVERTPAFTLKIDDKLPKGGEMELVCARDYRLLFPSQRKQVYINGVLMRVKSIRYVGWEKKQMRIRFQEVGHE